MDSIWTPEQLAQLDSLLDVAIAKANAVGASTAQAAMADAALANAQVAATVAANAAAEAKAAQVAAQGDVVAFVRALQPVVPAE